MDDQELEKIKYTDHDLLIILHTKLSRVILDISTFGKDLTSQVDKLSVSKHDKEAAEKIKVDADKIHIDHEKRLRRIERYVFMALGVLTLWQLYMTGHEANISTTLQELTASTSITGK